MARVAERKREEKKEKVISFNENLVHRERRGDMARIAIADDRKIISFDEFKDLVNSSGWERSQEIEIVDHFMVERWRAEWGGYVDVPHVVGWATKFNKRDDVEIIYVESWSYDEDDPDSFTTNSESWIVDGVEVFYEDGDKVMIFDLADALPGEFTEIDYSELNI